MPEFGALEPGRDAKAATTRSVGRWPDFIGIGTIKSGTTWLWQCLREHPQVFMPRMKELEYFDKRHEQGDDWYRGFFQEAGDRVCGEISPQYMHAPAAFERIAPLEGQVRLIVCFRNPADRAYSHFLMDARAESGLSGEAKARRFDELVRASGSKYVAFGHYADQLQPYLERFGREAVHAIFYDDIAADPQDVVRDVCAFLGVDTTFVPASLGARVNASKRYRSVRLFRLLQGCVRVVERVGLGELVLYLKRTAVRDRVLEALEVPAGYEPMWPQTRRELVRIYAEGNARLGHMFDRDLRGWSGVR